MTMQSVPAFPGPEVVNLKGFTCPETKPLVKIYNHGNSFLLKIPHAVF